MENTAKRLPERNFRAGSVNVSIWSNQGTKKTGEQFQFKSVSLERGYKDKDGQWKNTGSFRAADIPRLALALNKAYEYMVFNNVAEEIVM